MKRILIFNDSLAQGGTEVLLVDLVNHLAKEGCVVTLLLPEQSDKDVLLEQVSSRINIKYLYDKGTSHLEKKIGENIMIFFPSVFLKLKGLKDSDYDEVICFKDSFFAKMFTKMGIPKLLWIHNILYKRTYEIRSFREKVSVWLNKKQLKTTQRSYNRFDKVICVSDACKNAYINVLHDGVHPQQDIEVLYNAIDLSKVVEKSKQKIEDLPQGVTNFVLVTRSSPEKRTDRLVNAANRLNQDGYNFHVYILGEGLDNEDMIANLASLGLKDKITLMGRVDNPYPYILQSNWLLCVSERESFSLVLLEAMALGTPVITTNCGGPADIVDGGKYGILVDNSTEGVYEGMKRVLDDSTLSVQYSAYLDKVLIRFSYKGWLEKIDTILGLI
ncbi:glycosyltransferase [Dysgonomonas sp. ZJ279]|uniref:glycosyltransferase n=1 Tax=Dysgonomonas sp. ZJ279 TaxID=2709796 RepID=UPI0013EC3D6B|nr:glycosyltransferase [Dysgonomonas sp. ZJ279]